MRYTFQHNIANLSLCIFALWPQAYSHFLNYFYDGFIRILNTTPHKKLAWVVQLDWNNDVRLTLYQQPCLALNFSSNHISHQLLSADLWIESYCGIIMSVSWYYESHKIHIFTKFWMNSFKLLQLEYKSSSLYHIIIKGFIFIFLLKAHHQQDHFQSWKVEGAL